MLHCHFVDGLCAGGVAAVKRNAYICAVGGDDTNGGEVEKIIYMINLNLIFFSLVFFNFPMTNTLNSCDKCNYKGGIGYVDIIDQSYFHNVMVELESNTMSFFIDNCYQKGDSIKITGEVIFPSIANSNDSSNIKIYYCSLEGNRNNWKDSRYKIEQEINNDYKNGILNIKFKKHSRKFLIIYSNRFKGIVINLNKFR